MKAHLPHEVLDHLPHDEQLPWIHALWSRALAVLQRRRRRRQECPSCAQKHREACRLWRLADRWADKCLALETALAAEQAKRGIAPGAPVLGGPEEGLVSYAGLAPTGPNLDRIVARMIGPPIPAAPESPKEPRKLTYPEVVAMQSAKPPPVISDAMMETARNLASPIADSWGRVKLPVAPLVWTKGEVQMGRLVGVSEAQG